MNSRTKLRQQYHQETGKYWKKLNVNADPQLDYTKWLEDKIEQCNIANVVGRSEQLKCQCKKAQFTRTVDADFNPMCGRCGKAL